MEQNTTANPGKVAFLTILRRSNNFHRIQSFQLIAGGTLAIQGKCSTRYAKEFWHTWLHGYGYVDGMMFKIKLHMKVARCIGRKDYARALKYLDQIRTSEESNPYTVYMMAQCHEWSGDTESAMSAANEALSIDSGHFESLKLLADLYLAKKDYKKTTEYVQAALNNYPEPVAGPPRFFFWLLRVLSFIPAIGKLEEAVREDLEDPNKDTKSWFKWAKKYIEWYEYEYCEKKGPTIH